MKLQALRGMRDLMGPEASTFRWIDSQAWKIAERFGYQEIDTPIMESTEVFKRTLGNTTDIVNKEMYSFEDRGGDSVTLRPEGTAGVARAFISNGLYRQIPARFYYQGPMFRYERPQKGRYRQFNQIGGEILGLETPEADAEVISFAYLFLKEIGLIDSVKLELNTLGDRESRAAYREALVKHFTPFKEKLSEDSQTRLAANPLRILDSKDEKDQELITSAPSFEDSLNENSVQFFNSVKSHLDALGIKYELNQKLVRGLDYYCHSVFEFTTTDLGAQNAVLSGGRYDNLIENMGGKPTCGIGWAAGIERLAMLLEEKGIFVETKPPVAIIALGDAAKTKCMALSQELRAAGIAVEMFYTGTNIGKLMKKADKLGASHAIVVGSDDLASESAQLKNLKSGEQKSVGFKVLIDAL